MYDKVDSLLLSLGAKDFEVNLTIHLIDKRPHVQMPLWTKDPMAKDLMDIKLMEKRPNGQKT